MIPERDFQALMERIVADCMPDEIIPFSVGGASLIADLYAGRSVKARSHGKAEFGFTLTGDDVIDFVKLLTATFTLLKTASDWMRAHSDSETGASSTRERWKRELIKAGMAAKKADTIAGRFEAELAKSSAGR